MSAGALQSVSRAETQRGPVIGLLLTWDGERKGGEERREGQLQDSLQYFGFWQGEGSYPSLHMSCSFSPSLQKCYAASHISCLVSKSSWSALLFSVHSPFLCLPLLFVLAVFPTHMSSVSLSSLLFSFEKAPLEVSSCNSQKCRASPRHTGSAILR